MLSVKFGEWKTVIDWAGEEVDIAFVKNSFKNFNGVKKE